MKYKKIILPVVLSLALMVQGCSVSQFEAVLNEVGPAVLTILQIVALFKGVPADTSLPTKIDADVAGLEKLYTDWQAADTAAKPGVQTQINASFGVLTSDLGTIFSIAQVNDVNTQAKITALIGLIQTAVNIAEAAIPAPTPPAPAARLSHSVKLDADGLVSSWNKILTAKTGNAVVDAYTPKHKLHYHGKLVRVLSLGHAS